MDVVLPRPRFMRFFALKRLGLLACSLAFFTSVNGGEKAGWPIFRGNRGLTGVAQGQLPDKLALLWKFKVGDFIKASAVTGNGHAYLGSDNGKFYAINLATGKQAWVFEIKDPIEAPAM